MIEAWVWNENGGDDNNCYTWSKKKKKKNQISKYVYKFSY